MQKQKSASVLSKIVYVLRENPLLVLLSLLLIALPFNIRTYFPQEWTYVAGRFVEYRSPTLFATDFIVVAFMLSFLFLDNARNLLIKQFKEFINKWGIPIFISLLFLFFYTPLPGFPYFALRIVFYLLFFFCLQIWVSRQTFSLKDKWLRVIIALSVIVFAIQFIPLVLYTQNIPCDLCTKFGGINYVEQTFGVAYTSLQGIRWPRNYGFFPHPNVFAGFTVILFSFISYLFYSVKRKSFLLKALYLFFAVLSLFVISSTFSLAGLISFFIVLLVYFFAIKHGEMRSKFIINGAFFVAVSAVAVFAYLAKDASHFEIRNKLNIAALDTILHYPLSGVGVGNFVDHTVKYKITDANGLLFLQPVHNIFLLWLAEFGVILGGFTIFKFGQVFWQIFKQKKWQLLALLCPILIIGMVDHYFVTLNQGILIFVMIISFVTSQLYTNKNL